MSINCTIICFIIWSKTCNANIFPVFFYLSISLRGFITDYPTHRVKTCYLVYSSCPRGKGKVTLQIHIYGKFGVNRCALKKWQMRLRGQADQTTALGELARGLHNERPLVISPNHCTIMSPFNFTILQNGKNNKNTSIQNIMNTAFKGQVIGIAGI